jgi:23S rRNA pseudouridine1911/1915/1917 synthase
MIIPLEFAGQRLDRVLAQLYPQWSRSVLSAWLKEGVILVNQHAYKPNTKVWGGEHITFEALPDTATTHHQPENIPLNILFEDDAILVINKPAGLIVHPGAGNPEGTLLNALLHHASVFQQVPRAGIVHRLDKDTSGVMIVAKSLEAHTLLVRQMQEREIQRHYLALVYGRIIAGKTISTGYGRDPRNRIKMAVCTNGKPAVTEFTIKNRYPFTTLLHVVLHTGRTHQIRVHMAYIHHPIVGDPIYHGRNTLKAGMSATLRQTLTGFKRQALHAETLSLLHPISGSPLTFSAPIPYDFEELLTVLEQERDDEHLDG